MAEWRDISTAPKDGEVFIARNADHPSFGSWPMLRNVAWVMDENTGEYECLDRGGWLIVLDHDPSFAMGRKRAPSIPFSIAADKWNTSVRYEWQPLPAPPPSYLTPTEEARQHGSQGIPEALDDAG